MRSLISVTDSSSISSCKVRGMCRRQRASSVLGSLRKLGRFGLVAFIGLEVVFPAVFAVVGVSEDFQDEDAAGVVVDGGDKAVVIAGDVENCDGLGAADGGEVRMGKNFVDVRDALP